MLFNPFVIAGIPLAILYLLGTGIGYALDVVLGIPFVILVIWLLNTLMALAVFAGGILGMKATDPTRKNAFRLRDHGTGSHSSNKRISAAALFQHLRFCVDRTVQCQDVDLDDGVLILDLDNALTVTRGAR
jgi:hypothetical protein